MDIPQATSETVSLPAYNTLTVASISAGSGSVTQLSDSADDNAVGVTAVAAAASVTFGPYSSTKKFLIRSASGLLRTTIAPVDFPTLAEVQATLPIFIGTVGDFCEIVGAGVPDNAVTGLNVAGKGSRYTNISAGKLYINGGTKAVPDWKIVTSA